MTLAFSTRWPKDMPAHMAGQPTEFVDQIWNCLQFDETFGEWPDNRFVFDSWSSHIDAYFLKHKTSFPFLNQQVTCGNHVEKELKMKKHSLREDPKDLWKAGRDIHFVINNRTKQRFQFAPVVKCVSVQKVEILWDKLRVKVAIDGVIHSGASFWKPGDLKTVWGDMHQLAINDGFDSELDFFSWFDKDFTGKIIHWTNIKY